MIVLSDNLKRFRVAKGMTQEQAADTLSVSAQTISRWECGVTLPDATMLPEIARLYAVTIDDLYRENSVAYKNYAQRLASVYETTRDPEDYMQTVREFNTLLRSGQYDVDDLRTLGIMYQFMFMYCKEQAFYYFDRAIRECGPEDADMKRRTEEQKLRMAALIGQAEASVSKWETAAEQSSDDAEAQILLAVAYMQAQQYDAAYQHIQKAILRFPEEWELYIHAGNTCRHLGRYDEALAFEEQALQLRPDYVDAKYEMAWCYLKMGEKQKAAELYLQIADQYQREGLDVEAAEERRNAKTLLNGTKDDEISIAEKEI